MSYLYRTYKGPLYCLLYKSRFLYPAWWAECAYCQGTISSISHQTTCSQSSQAGFQIKPKHQQSLAHFSYKWLAIFGPRLTQSPSKHTALPLTRERHSSKSPLAVKASFLSHWSSSHLDHSRLALHMCSVRSLDLQELTIYPQSENKHLEQSHSFLLHLFLIFAT